LGARLTFRNAAPSGAAEGTGGAIAVLWLPEHAPTATGSFPMLRAADERQPQG
ncbi:two-component sensor histidine kinase, partial [Streptomyces sp. SID8455]|nr:two-component sensor histidine kinase [Streptomyces sp. SID8455]